MNNYLFGIVLPAMARAAGEERRQWALGIGTAAGSIGQFAVVPVAQVLIDTWGWITALNVLAGTSLTMALLATPLAPYSGKQETVQKIEGQTVPKALQEALSASGSAGGCTIRAENIMQYGS